MDPVFWTMVEKAAGTIGLTVDKLWPAFVGYTKFKWGAWAAVEILVFALAPVFAAGFTFWARRTFGRDSDPGQAVPVICWVAAVALMFICAISIPNAVAGYMFPEARAVLDLVGETTRR